MWREYFNLVGIVPGKVILPGNREIDFRNDNLDIQLLLNLFEKDFPYLQLTEKGKQTFYQVEPKKTTAKRRRKK